MAKSISTLYLDAYASIATKQNVKYGNPTAAQIPAPAHIPAALERAIQSGRLTTEQARKLAPALGRKAYGEVGLTPGVARMVMDKVLGFNALGWQRAMELESDLSIYSR